tara:strand:+ start:638 stop:1183 length:546 start_codon:yes stop_codon:yes gene_type:complete
VKFKSTITILLFLVSCSSNQITTEEETSTTTTIFKETVTTLDRTTPCEKWEMKLSNAIAMIGWFNSSHSIFVYNWNEGNLSTEELKADLDENLFFLTTAEYRYGELERSGGEEKTDLQLEIENNLYKIINFYIEGYEYLDESFDYGLADVEKKELGEEKLKLGFLLEQVTAKKVESFSCNQ